MSGAASAWHVKSTFGKDGTFGRIRSVCAETHSEKIQKDRDRELQKQKEDRYGEQISWDELSLLWSLDEEQPAPAGGMRGESEGEPHHG